MISTAPVSQEDIDPLGRIKHVTVLYNLVDKKTFGESQDLLADDDTFKTAKTIYETLLNENFIVDLFPLSEENVSKLLEIQTDFIFNICYGIGSLPKTEDEVVKILEKTGIPFSGASAKAIRITTDKLSTKKIFIEKNTPTPAYQIFVSDLDKIDSKLRYPLIVKPKNEDCSLGIHNDAVVTNEETLRNRLSYVLKTYNEPVLVEEYIEGRELNVTMVGNGNRIDVLPISEITFGSSYQDGIKWKIVDFEAKWIENSSSYHETNGVCPAILTPDIINLIEKYAIRIFKSTGCKDYARVDLRLSNENIPYFLEVNINPGIGPSDGAVRSAKAAGMTYSGFLKRLMREALYRYLPLERPVQFA